MVRDYETPTVPRSWDGFAREWADRLGLREKKLALVCSPDRYGNAVVLRITTDAGSEITYARRSSDADDAAERREGFLAATASDGVREIVEDRAKRERKGVWETTKANRQDCDIPRPKDL